MRHFFSILNNAGTLTCGAHLAFSASEMGFVLGFLALSAVVISVCNTIEAIETERGDELWAWAEAEHELLIEGNK